MASTITGGIKFFEKSKCLLEDGASAAVSSGDMVSDYLLDKNPITNWNSVGSSDSTTETIEITFPQEAAIDRILLLNHNFKEYTIQYWNGSSYVDFTSVYGMSGALGGGISETTYSADTSYYEFSEVTTALIKISVVKTQVANDEKYVFQVIATKELGTLLGYPKINSAKHSRNISASEMLSGKQKIVKGFESFSCKLKFDNYPSRSTYHDDLDLVFTLWDSQDPFIIWLCGGRGSTYFGYQMRGFRLRDAYHCQVKGDLPVGYYKNTYTLPVDFELQIEEHV